MAVHRSSGNRGVSSPTFDDAARTPDIQIPRLNTDPIWSLCPWSVTVRLGGRDFEIPAMSATGWLRYLMQPEPDIDGIILDLLPATEEMLFDGVLSTNELYETLLDTISLVCARPWWVALRQIQVARTSWHVLGPQMLEKIDFEHVSIAAWLDVLLVVTLSSIDPKEATMFVLRLEAPPTFDSDRAEVPVPIDHMEMDRGAFLSMR